jgi:hypothetical protein
MTREEINTLIREMTKEAGLYQRVPTLTCARTAQLLSCAAMLLADMQRQLATTEESSAVHFNQEIK